MKREKKKRYLKNLSRETEVLGRKRDNRIIAPISRLNKKQLKEEERYNLVRDYLTNTFSTDELSQKYKTSTKNVLSIIDGHIKALVNTRETQALVATQRKEKYMGSASITKLSVGMRSILERDTINERFLSLTSEDESGVLTESEVAFAYHWVYGSNGIKALEESGLDVGLIKPMGDKKHPAGAEEMRAFTNACKIRSLFLRRKGNVQSFVREMQDKNLNNLRIDKSYVMGLVINEIEELREDKDSTSRKLLGGHIDRLANMGGLYKHTIDVNTINMGNALDKMIELAKADVEDGDILDVEVEDAIIVEEKNDE